MIVMSQIFTKCFGYVMEFNLYHSLPFPRRILFYFFVILLVAVFQAWHPFKSGSFYLLLSLPIMSFFHLIL